MKTTSILLCLFAACIPLPILVPQDVAVDVAVEHAVQHLIYVFSAMFCVGVGAFVMIVLMEDACNRLFKPPPGVREGYWTTT